MDPTLLPADLADPPMTDLELDQFFEAWVGLADEAALDLPAALEYLVEGTDPTVNRRVSRWRVEDDATAEWAGRKLAAAQQHYAEQNALRDEWVRKIDMWLASETAHDKREREFFTFHLEDYAIRRRAAGGGATLNLPSVTLRASNNQPAAKVADEPVLADYIESKLDEPAWERAIGAAGVLAETVVKRTPKVYVAPFRALVRLEPRTVGYEEHATLACSHEIVGAIATLRDNAAGGHAIGEVLDCDVCGYRQAIYAIDLVPVTEPVVVGPDGEPVPGTSVDPGGISPKVTVHA